MVTTDLYTVSGAVKPSFPAIRFLGGNVDDYLQVNAHAAARVAANDTKGTYGIRFMCPDITGTYTLVGAGDDNVVEFLEINVEAGLITVRCTDATVAQFVTQADAVAIKAHTWHTLIVVQAADGTGVKIYVDGTHIASTNDTATDVNEWYNNLDGIDTFRVGAANKAGDASVTQEFTGYISTVKYWNKALDEVEINRLTQTVSSLDNPLDDDSTYLQLYLDMDNDYVDAGLGADNGTAVGDICLVSWASEFTSKFTFNPEFTTVTADNPRFVVYDGVGYGLITDAA